MCAAVIRAGRAAEIALALERAHELGRGVSFLTLTLRHTRDDELSFTLDTLQQAWRKVTSWRAFKDLAELLGVVGSIRSTEITVGHNGWHPHAHLATITGEPLSDELRSVFETELSRIWQKAVVSLGGRVPSRERGVKVLAADDPRDGLSDYITKVQEQVGKQRHGIARELARGDLKAGRAGSAHPFELLDDDTGSTRVHRLWSEYYEATRGRRAFGWSRGLREELIPDVEVLDDDQLLQRSERGELLGLIDGRMWDARYRDSPAMMHGALVAAESCSGAPLELLG